MLADVLERDHSGAELHAGIADRLDCLKDGQTPEQDIAGMVHAPSVASAGDSLLRQCHVSGHPPVGADAALVLERQRADLAGLAGAFRWLPEGLQSGAIIRLVFLTSAAVERPPLLELVLGAADKRGPPCLDATQVGDEQPVSRFRRDGGAGDVPDGLERTSETTSLHLLQVPGGDRGDGAGDVVDLRLAQVMELDPHACEIFRRIRRGSGRRNGSVARLAG